MYDVHKGKCIGDDSGGRGVPFSHLISRNEQVGPYGEKPGKQISDVLYFCSRMVEPIFHFLLFVIIFLHMYSYDRVRHDINT